MNDTTLIELAPALPRPNPLGAAAKRLVLGRLVGLERGTLRVHERGTCHEFRGTEPGPVGAWAGAGVAKTPRRPREGSQRPRVTTPLGPRRSRPGGDRSPSDQSR